MENIDPSAYDDDYPLARRGDWLLDGLGRHNPCGWLTPGTSVRVLIDRNNQEELWVGDVIERHPMGCLLRLWGSGKLLPIPFNRVLRAGVVPRHTHAEFRLVVAFQRGGHPARERGVQPVLELSWAMAAKVTAYGSAKGLTTAQATEKLIGVALGRLAVLERHALKQRARSVQVDRAYSVPDARRACQKTQSA